ncbi:hypothetical protein ACGFX4_19565 [Kitasatospora sp. NPDC048365]|uniref:hypothetical protein n=1 Tax=Kitasatospora sp. NPDC048365 TaxID=3364050 RepID=UPI00372422E0
MDHSDQDNPDQILEASRSWQAISEPWSQVSVIRAVSGTSHRASVRRAWTLVRAVSLGQGDKADEAGAAVDEGGDGGAVLPAGDQIALPVAGPFPELNDGGALVDEGRWDGEPWRPLVGLAALFAQRPAGPELLGECPAQAPLAPW